MTFDYYLQDDGTKSVRRYPPGEQHGQRWDRDKLSWSADCAPRRACELTGDRLLRADQLHPAML